MDRIQKVSSYLLVFFNILLVLIPLGLLILWLYIDIEPIKNAIRAGLLFGPVETPDGIVNLGMIGWNPIAKFTGFVASLLEKLPILLGLLILKCIFLNAHLAATSLGVAKINELV